MRLGSIAAALLLPVLAAASDDSASTTTYTSTLTQVMTITIARLYHTTATWNATASYYPTGTGGLSVLPTSTSASSTSSTSAPAVSPIVKSGASALGPGLALAGVAGAVVAAML